ncbi:MAG: hypothetical protein ABWY58_05305, partial [Aeromicrobium sp.]
SPDVERVVVAELHGQIVDLMRDGTIPGADLLDDSRLEVVVGDVREVVAAQSPASFDAILLDVDNGPDFLVHDANAHVYRAEFVATCAARLVDEGLLSVWSMADSDALRRRLVEHFDDVRAEPVDVRLQGRDERYWILAGRRPRRRAIVPT